jgi:uncharacterized membrane protein
MEGLAVAIEPLKMALEAISALCVFIGLVTTFMLAANLMRRRRELSLTKLRLRFGSWLGLALEFQLGADILSTTTAPSFEDLLKLAAIAAIRTFLNYFLSKELSMEHQTSAAEERAL